MFNPTPWTVSESTRDQIIVTSDDFDTIRAKGKQLYYYCYYYSDYLEELLQQTLTNATTSLRHKIIHSEQ